ncbi:MAG: hypothetical protein Q8L87_15585 [Anaerolineales bacterium]|nr:hypothetical protein [Anaerolineales bacterium]
MQNKHRFLFFGLAGVLTALLLSMASKPVSAHELSRIRFEAPQQTHLNVGSEQTNPCLVLLLEAANQAGVEGTLDYTSDGDMIHSCFVNYVVLSETRGEALWVVTPEATSTYLSVGASNQESCDYSPHQQDRFKLTTFHGYNARILHWKGDTRLVDDEPWTSDRKGIDWCMYKGGLYHHLSIETISHSIERYGPARDPLEIADVLLSLAEDRLPLLDLPVEPAQPVDPGDVVPGQPEAPTDQTVPTEAGGLFGIPIPVILGSLGIPIAGAVAGAVVSSLISFLGTSSPIPANVSSGSIPETGMANDQGFYWSERPWDVAGPGYVTRDEYVRTKEMLAQGYKWTNGGWQTPDEIQQSDQWQQNNRDAVAREDEQFLKELEKNKQRDFPQQDLRTFDMRLGDFKEDLYALEDELEKTNYVLNPYQGDPTILIHRAICLKNMAYDATIGQFTGEQGLTCEGYVQKTSNKANAYLQKHFPGATVESVVFEERSSQPDASGVKNWLDSCIDDNHNLLRVNLPDGSQWAVDFHQNRAGKAPLVRKWDEARKVWRDYMGESEFIERTSYTLGGN